MFFYFLFLVQDPCMCTLNHHSLGRCLYWEYGLLIRAISVVFWSQNKICIHLFVRKKRRRRKCINICLARIFHPRSKTQKSHAQFSSNRKSYWVSMVDISPAIAAEKPGKRCGLDSVDLKKKSQGQLHWWRGWHPCARDFSRSHPKCLESDSIS